MVRHGGSSAGSYLTDPTSPIPSHCASIVATSTVRVNNISGLHCESGVQQLIFFFWDLTLFRSHCNNA